MDALALLCNLHADGPETLQRLKATGCDRLEFLEALEHDELSGVLGGSAAATRRFLDEARSLSLRLTGHPLDEGAPLLPEVDLEEVASKALGAEPDDDFEDDVVRHQPPSPTPMVARGPVNEAKAYDHEEHVPLHVQPEAASSEPCCSQPAARASAEPLAEVVLQAWRELDAGASFATPGILVPQPSSNFDLGGGAGAAEPRADLAQPVAAVPSAREAASDHAPYMLNGANGVERGVTPLATANVEGLTDDVRAALIDAGYTALEELEACSVLDVSKRSGLAYTHVARLSFLVRRALSAQAAAAQPAPAHAEQGKPSLASVGGAFDEGTSEPMGGPFS